MDATSPSLPVIRYRSNGWVLTPVTRVIKQGNGKGRFVRYQLKQSSGPGGMFITPCRSREDATILVLETSIQKVPGGVLAEVLDKVIAQLSNEWQCLEVRVTLPLGREERSQLQRVLTQELGFTLVTLEKNRQQYLFKRLAGAESFRIQHINELNFSIGVPPQLLRFQRLACTKHENEDWTVVPSALILRESPPQYSRELLKEQIQLGMQDAKERWGTVEFTAFLMPGCDWDDWNAVLQDLEFEIVTEEAGTFVAILNYNLTAPS